MKTITLAASEFRKRTPADAWRDRNERIVVLDDSTKKPRLVITRQQEEILDEDGCSGDITCNCNCVMCKYGRGDR